MHQVAGGQGSSNINSQWLIWIQPLRSGSGTLGINTNLIGSWLSYATTFIRQRSKVFIDRDVLSDGSPPLLKERRYLRKDAAEQLWKSLQTQGWRKRVRYNMQLPNHERSPLLLLTVLPPHRKQQEEGDGVKNERDKTSEGGIPQRSFFGSGNHTKCAAGYCLRFQVTSSWQSTHTLTKRSRSSPKGERRKNQIACWCEFTFFPLV